MSLNLINEGDASLQVLRSVVDVFGMRSVWVGSAPGAEGIQSVITAFAAARAVEKPHRLLLRQRAVAPATPTPPSKQVEGPRRQARQWFEAARYRLLAGIKIENFGSINALTDKAVCPGK